MCRKTLRSPQFQYSLKQNANKTVTDAFIILVYGIQKINSFVWGYYNVIIVLVVEILLGTGTTGRQLQELKHTSQVLYGECLSTPVLHRSVPGTVVILL